MPGKVQGGLERKSTSGSTKRTSPQDPALPEQFSVGFHVHHDGGTGRKQSLGYNGLWAWTSGTHYRWLISNILDSNMDGLM